MSDAAESIRAGQAGGLVPRVTDAFVYRQTHASHIRTDVFFRQAASVAGVRAPEVVGGPGTGRRTPTADHRAVEAADEEEVHRARSRRRSCRNDKDVVIDM